jgi:hypothetical protein
MLGRFRCPNCGEHGGILAEEGSGIPRCPRCAHSLLIEPLIGDRPETANRDIDDAVVSWVSQPAPAPASKTDRVAACRACGFEGVMQYESDRADTICPACLSVFRSRPERSGQVVPCPNCAQPIELGEKDRGKTIVCAACNYFLGCVLPFEKRRFGTFQFLNSMFDTDK